MTPVNGGAEKMMMKQKKKQAKKRGLALLLVAALWLSGFGPATVVAYGAETASAPEEVVQNADTSLVVKKPETVNIATADSKAAVEITASAAPSVELYRATALKGKYKKIKILSCTTGKALYWDKTVTTGKRYYYKCRAVKTDAAKTVKSAFTDPIRVQVSKTSIGKKAYAAAQKALAEKKATDGVPQSIYKVAEAKTTNFRQAVVTLLAKADGEWKRAICVYDLLDDTIAFVEKDTFAYRKNDKATWKEAYAQATAKFYDVAENLRYIEGPTKKNSVINDILYCFLRGRYNLHFQYKTQSGAEKGEELIYRHFRDVCASYPDLAGFYANGNLETNIYRTKGKWYLDIDITGAALDCDALFLRQQQALTVCLSIYNGLRQQGKIRAGMSEKQIAEVYMQYLQSLNISTSGLPLLSRYMGQFMRYDSVYGCLILGRSDCVGRAATFNLLMHVEDISGQGISGRFINSYVGHELNRVVLDGQEYFCDWGNQIPLCSEAELTKVFLFNKTPLTWARSRAAA